MSIPFPNCQASESFKSLDLSFEQAGRKTELGRMGKSGRILVEGLPGGERPSLYMYWCTTAESVMNE